MPTCEPVAWRVKDFADGWILCHSEAEARGEAEGAGNLVQPLYATADLVEALVAAKQHMWIDAASHWTMADFKSWAIIQQIDAALTKADGVAR